MHARPQHSIVILKSIMHPFMLAWLRCKEVEKFLFAAFNTFDSLQVKKTSVFECNLNCCHLPIFLITGFILSFWL